MSILIVPVLYGLILFVDFRLTAPPHNSKKRERILYRTLIVLAVLISIPTSFALSLDHVGASLSGLISLFAR